MSLRERAVEAEGSMMVVGWSFLQDRYKVNVSC